MATMKLYLLGGLGADERVFSFLDLNINTQVIRWIDPIRNEGLSNYASRLLDQLDQTQQFSICGVSFGGMVALELAKYCNPEKVVLISSVQEDGQLPLGLKFLGKLGVLKWLPNFMIKPPSFIMSFLFSARNKALLKQIIKDTSPRFIRWALEQITLWKHDDNAVQIKRIHGTNDRLIPLRGGAIKIEGGGHFMIVDHADEISKKLNEYFS